MIGPGGVFTVNVQYQPTASVWVKGDTFLVDGQGQACVRDSRHEAQLAARLLSSRVSFEVPAVGLIVVAGARRSLTVKSQPAGVHVVARRQLNRWLERRARFLNGEEVAAVYAVARKSTTWR